MSVISLLTDFGTDDAYGGIMKGVILTIAPKAQLIDITHQISPQNLIQAAYQIHSAYRYFPKGTVHVIVVDPGVGSQRSILAVAADEHFFLAPDNGVLTLIIEKSPICRVVKVENELFFLTPVSNTFHGRDIFAPVAARISLGTDIAKLGSNFSPAEVVRLSLPKPIPIGKGKFAGTIIDIDRFGNLITNIDEVMIRSLLSQSSGNIVVHIKGHIIAGLSGSYADASPGTPLAILGSRGYLEISVNRGNAKRHFDAIFGDFVEIITT
jgi:S-adenosyl-L-methionine hydrolase (adenosine-forming)